MLSLKLSGRSHISTALHRYAIIIKFVLVLLYQTELQMYLLYWSVAHLYRTLRIFNSNVIFLFQEIFSSTNCRKVTKWEVFYYKICIFDNLIERTTNSQKTLLFINQFKFIFYRILPNIYEIETDIYDLFSKFYCRIVKLLVIIMKTYLLKTKLVF